MNCSFPPFCHLKVTGKPGRDIECMSTPSFMAGASVKVLVSTIMGLLMMYHDLLSKNGIQLSRKGSIIFGCRLVEVVRCNLNCWTLGDRIHDINAHIITTD